MHKVLVLDANQRSALAIIRSLGRQGLKVIAGDHQTAPLGAASKYAAAFVPYPNPATSPGAFVAEIISIASRLAINTIVPATDLTTMLLVSQSDLSRIARLAAPSGTSYEALTDKARLVKLAATLGIPVPMTRIAKTAPEIVMAAQDIGFPLVLKPARSRFVKADRIVSTNVRIVKDPGSLCDVLRQETWVQDIPCLVQRFVPGHGAGVFALYGSSVPIAWFAHRRIREKPPTGGVSVLCESVHVDPVMQSYAAKLLAAADWTGVAMVEFRVDKDGTPYLMEVNGRFWGSLQLAIDSGIDFPWLLHRLIQGDAVAGPPRYAVGRRLRWLMGDLDSLLISVRNAETSLGTKARTLTAFLWSFVDPACRQEILRIDDPYPAIREMAQWVKALRA